MSENTHTRFGFLRNKPVLFVTAVLIAEIVALNLIPTKEYIPTPPPLGQFSTTLGSWHMVADIPVDDYIQSLLKADDTLYRRYLGPGMDELFVAFFKSQRAGVTPHSPKVCLPGNGWTPQTSRIISLAVPGEPRPIPVNRYVVSNGDSRKLVLYWYQNAKRVTANEYLSKFYLIYDALRYHRSDEALVRVTTDLGVGDAQAEEHALEFIRQFYQPLKTQMWMAPPGT